MRHLKGTVLVLVLASALVACGSGDDDTSSGGGEDAGGSGDLLTLRLGSTDLAVSPYLTVITLAEEEGWWAEEGLRIDHLSGVGGGNVTQALAAGNTDLAIANTEATVVAAQQDPAIKLLGGYCNSNLYSWVALDGDAEVEGATLGLTSATSGSALIVNTYADANPDLDIEGQVVGGIGDQLAAVRSGRITAMTSPPPITEQMVAEGATVLLSGTDMVGELPMNFLAVSSEFAEAHPEALESFWRVIDRGFTYLLDEPEDAAERLSTAMDFEAEHIQTWLESDSAAACLTTDQSPEMLENVDDVLTSGGVIDEPVDWATLLDQSFLPEDARADLTAVAAQ